MGFLFRNYVNLCGYVVIFMFDLWQLAQVIYYSTNWKSIEILFFYFF
jgi:hypothetical protein